MCCGAPSKIPSISEKLEQIYEDRSHILGDAAYEIRHWLLTRYRNFESLTPQKKKQSAATRVRVKKDAFGILKKRFIQLVRVEFREVDVINKCTIACCVLHNYCIDA